WACGPCSKTVLPKQLRDSPPWRKSLAPATTISKPVKRAPLYCGDKEVAGPRRAGRGRILPVPYPGDDRGWPRVSAGRCPCHGGREMNGNRQPRRNVAAGGAGWGNGQIASASCNSLARACHSALFCPKSLIVSALPG